VAPSPAEWVKVAPGKWLGGVLAELKAAAKEVDPGPSLHATLRPYQRAGVAWLHLVTGLGLGGCLADDMGLGKTIQVLALLLATQRERPSLLVAPASLLSNWTAEIERFAPSLRT